MIALAVTAALIAGRTGRAEPVEPTVCQAPGLWAAGQGEWLWIVWLDKGGQADKDGQPTRLLAKADGKPWSPTQEYYLPAVAAAAARGDQLTVGLPDGSMFLYKAQGSHGLEPPLPPRFLPIDMAGDASRLYVLAAGPASPQATGRPAETQPADRPHEMSRAATLRLFARQNGRFEELPPLPAELAAASRISLVAHLLQPRIIALTEDGLALWERTEQAGPSSGQWKPTAIHAESLPRLAEIEAVSVNKRLYLIVWPEGPDSLPLIGLLRGEASGEGPDVAVTLEALRPMPETRPALTIQTRRKSWDLAATGDRVVLVRLDPDRAGLQVRRFDPQSLQFEDDWQAVGAVAGRGDWLIELFHSPWFAGLMLAILVLLLVLRRPGGVIRLPMDAAPARLSARMAAFLIDNLPCQLAAMVLMSRWDHQAFQLAAEAARTRDWQNTNLLILGLIGLGLFLAYQILAESVWATTVGKRIFHLSVYSTDGTRPTVWQVVLRNLIKGLELAAAPLVLLLVVIHPARQRLGDILAGTIVVGPRRHGRGLPPGTSDRPGPPIQRPGGRDDDAGDGLPDS